MSRSDGIRPAPEQKGRPLSKVTTWILDTYGEVGLDGRPLPRQRPRFQGTAKEARVARQRLVAELIAGSSVAAASGPSAPEARAGKSGTSKQLPSFEEFVRKTYLPHVDKEHPASTYRTKRRHFENHILPTLGALRLDDANTKEAANKLKAYLVDHPRIRKNSFRNLILLTYSAALGHAADHDGGPGLLPSKVKVKHFSEDKRKGVSVAGFRAGHLRHKRFSEAEIQKLLAAASMMPNPAWWRVLILLGASVGCRVGEAAARKWSDIDWDKRRIEISSIICSETTEEVLDHTKNGVLTGNPISDELYQALQALRKDPTTRASKYILGAGESRPYLTIANVEDRFAILAKKAFGKRSRNYHRLRHTCASTLADNGENPEVIRQLMRHESLKTTYGYIQPSESSLAQAVNGLNYARKTGT